VLRLVEGEMMKSRAAEVVDKGCGWAETDSKDGVAEKIKFNVGAVEHAEMRDKMAVWLEVTSEVSFSAALELRQVYSLSKSAR